MMLDHVVLTDHDEATVNSLCLCFKCPSEFCLFLPKFNCKATFISFCADIAYP